MPKEPYVHPPGGQVTKMGGLFNDFLEYDFTMDSDIVKCPYCGADVLSYLLILIPTFLRIPE